MWRDSEEREVFDVWVTIVIFSVSFKDVLFLILVKIDILCGVIGDHCFFLTKGEVSYVASLRNLNRN